MASRQRDQMRWTSLWAGLIVLAACALAVASPGSLPTRLQAFRVVATFLLVGGALRLSSGPARLGCAAAWLALMLLQPVPLVAEEWGRDFTTFYQGARLLFGAHQSPYAAPGATAFPFPTFLLVDLVSLNGGLSQAQSFRLFYALEALALGIGLVLFVWAAGRTVWAARAPQSAEALLVAGLALQPPILAGLAWGNSGALGGAAIMGAFAAWQGGRSRISLHGAAICLTLAWMIKPQLAMAAAFFLASALVEQRRTDRSRAAEIGRLALPWAAAMLLASLPLGWPGSLHAYRAFGPVAFTWHTEVAQRYFNNLALSLRIADGLKEAGGRPMATHLPLLAAVPAALILLANLRSLVRGSRDSALAFLPWLLASLLWTSLVWDWYLTLVLTAPLYMVSLAVRNPGRRAPIKLAAGIACCTVAAASVFCFGLLLLYVHALEIRGDDAAHLPALAEGIPIAT